jgi:hypothetical protein
MMCGITPREGDSERHLKEEAESVKVADIGAAPESTDGALSHSFASDGGAGA